MSKQSLDPYYEYYIIRRQDREIPKFLDPPRITACIGILLSKHYAYICFIQSIHTKLRQTISYVKCLSVHRNQRQDHNTGDLIIYKTSIRFVVHGSCVVQFLLPKTVFVFEKKIEKGAFRVEGCMY